MLFTIVGVSVLSGSLVVATNAFAQTNPQTTVPSLVQEIATKFGISQSDVKAVFTKHQQEMQAKNETNYEDYLANLVKTGKITQEQEQLILNEHKKLMTQMKADMQNAKSMTPAERKVQMQITMKEIKDWAKQNNIDVKYLRPFRQGIGGFGGMGKRLSNPSPTITPMQ